MEFFTGPCRTTSLPLCQPVVVNLARPEIYPLRARNCAALGDERGAQSARLCHYLATASELSMDAARRAMAGWAVYCRGSGSILGGRDVPGHKKTMKGTLNWITIYVLSAIVCCGREMTAFDRTLIRAQACSVNDIRECASKAACVDQANTKGETLLMVVVAACPPSVVRFVLEKQARLMRATSKAVRHWSFTGGFNFEGMSYEQMAAAMNDAAKQALLMKYREVNTCRAR
jgi:hypothetical protein